MPTDGVRTSSSGTCPSRRWTDDLCPRPLPTILKCSSNSGQTSSKPNRAPCTDPLGCGYVSTRGSSARSVPATGMRSNRECPIPTTDRNWLSTPSPELLKVEPVSCYWAGERRSRTHYRVVRLGPSNRRNPQGLTRPYGTDGRTSLSWSISTLPAAMDKQATMSAGNGILMCGICRLPLADHLHIFSHELSELSLRRVRSSGVPWNDRPALAGQDTTPARIYG